MPPTARKSRSSVSTASVPLIRVELGIPASTWRLWLQTHPDFAEAVEEADDAARAALEKLGRLGVKMGPGFNARTLTTLTPFARQARGGRAQTSLSDLDVVHPVPLRGRGLMGGSQTAQRAEACRWRDPTRLRLRWPAGASPALADRRQAAARYSREPRLGRLG